MQSLVGRVALVTGGASGLGRATALRLVNAGARVAILDLPTQPGGELEKEIGGGRSLFVPADVTSPADVTKALDAVFAKWGQLNAVVQCAGIATATKVLSKKGVHNLDLFAKVIQVNTVGTFNVLRLSAERMAAAPAAEGSGGERGVIINTSSISAFDGQIGQAAYAASKGAVAAMTLPIARELSSQGIRIVTIAPGLFLTPLLEKLPEKVIAELGAEVPFPSRLGRPDEYAALAQHIIENGYINGEVIRIDGALRMRP